MAPVDGQNRRPRPFSHPLTHLLAWVVIMILVLLSVLGGQLEQAPVDSGGTTDSRTLQPLPMADDMNGRMLLGLNEMDGAFGPMLLDQAAPMKNGTPEQQLAYVILTSELVSPEEGVKALEALHESIDAGTLEDLPEGYDQLLEVVGGLLFSTAAGETAAPPSVEDRSLLEASLGIYGTYLLAHATDDTQAISVLESQFSRAVFGLLAVMVWFLVAGFSGFVLLVLFIVFRLTGRLQLKFLPGTGTGSVYLETFALWLFLFMAFSIAIPLLYQLVTGEDLAGIGQQGQLLIGLITMFLSLVVLVWPVIRGVRFSDVCEDIGLVPGRWFREIVAGVATYCAALPLLLFGVILFMVLSAIWVLLFDDTPQPNHPIQDSMGSGIVGLVLVYLVACVAAPIVEEIMFRGFLYRYLRDGTSKLLWFGSFVIAAFVSSFIFAIIHPQGVVFVPVLGALAIGFCLGREWRGSLIAPMVAHALNNGVVMTLNVFISG